MKFKTSLKPTPPSLTLTPFVAVSFAMLLFFAVTSLTLPFKSLHIEMPSLPLSAEPLTSQIVVAMDAHHILYVGNKKEITTLAGLKQALEQELATFSRYHTKAKPTLVLQIDKVVSYGSFLPVLITAEACCPRLRLAFIEEAP